jgi:hypothetical protein
MPIKIRHTPSLADIALLSQRGGLGQYRLKQQELDIKRYQLAQNRQIAEMNLRGQIGMRREANQAALQRMAFDAQIGARRDRLQQIRIGARAGEAQQAQFKLMQGRQAAMDVRHGLDLALRREQADELAEKNRDAKEVAKANEAMRRSEVKWRNQSAQRKEQLLSSIRESIGKFGKELAKNPGRMGQKIHDSAMKKLRDNDPVAFDYAEDIDYQVEDKIKEDLKAAGIVDNKAAGFKLKTWPDGTQTLKYYDDSGHFVDVKKPDNPKIAEAEKKFLRTEKTLKRKLKRLESYRDRLVEQYEREGKNLPPIKVDDTAKHEGDKRSDEFRFAQQKEDWRQDRWKAFNKVQRIDREIAEIDEQLDAGPVLPQPQEQPQPMPGPEQQPEGAPPPMPQPGQQPEGAPPPMPQPELQPEGVGPPMSQAGQQPESQPLEFNKQDLAAINKFVGNPKVMLATKALIMLIKQYPGGPETMPEEDRQEWCRAIRIWGSR